MFLIESSAQPCFVRTKEGASVQRDMARKVGCQHKLNKTGACVHSQKKNKHIRAPHKFNHPNGNLNLQI
jgi:hypothetical protein